MNLRDGVLYVRTMLTELRARFFSDTEIIIHLNDAAKRMCSAAQCINGFATFNTAQIGGDGDNADSWAQEYVLPLDIDQITGAAYFAGTVFPIQPVPREAIQLGGYVGGIPFYFYEKKNTTVLTPQVAGGEIIELPIQGDMAVNPRTTIGLYPVPQQALPIYIWYLAWHPTMKNPFDICQIPERFKKGWCAYAIARLKEKEGALADAQYWDAQHEAEAQAFVDYMITNGQEITPPIYANRPIPPYFLRGANTVLVVAQNPTFSNL